MTGQEPPTTIAILGGNPVVGGALSVLLEGFGYSTKVLEAYPSGVVDELLDGADLLLLTPRVDEGVRGLSSALWARALRKRQACR
jgi:hypothetical protein